jgi:DNA-binding transcriptional LysR family regulator
MNIRQLQYIATVAEYCSFTKAAKALYIAQPSLSTYISKVEAELGVALFDRNTTPLSLTYAGEEYLKYAEKVLADYRFMEKRMQDIAQKQIGRIRVGIPNERAAYMLPVIMSVYRHQYPQIEVQLFTGDSTNMIDMILRKKVDLAFLPHNFKNSLIATEEIYQEKILLVGNDQFIQKRHLIEGMPDAVDLQAIQELPLITLQPSRGIRIFLDELFEKHHIRPKIATEVFSNMIAYRLASAGQGVTIVPHMTVALTRVVEPVPVYLLSACPIHWNIIVAYRKDTYLSEAERKFIVTARAVLRSELDNNPSLRQDSPRTCNADA